MTKPFHIALVVWGEKFACTFTEVTLPNHLSQGNIPDLPLSSKGGHTYHIFTTRSDGQLIECADSFKRLRQSIRVEFHYIDHLLEALYSETLSKHDVMTKCHATACRIAAQNKGALIILGPELIISRGMLHALSKRVEAGARVVLIGSYRSTKETAINDLLENYYVSKDDGLSIAPRELVALSLQHFHRWSASLCWNSQNFESPWPAFLYWPVGNKGLLQRGIHLCPILSVPQQGDELDCAPKGRGIDGTDYVDRISSDFSDVHVITDSDELCVMGLTEDEPSRPPDLPNLITIARWLTEHAFPNHIYFLKEKIRFHAEDLSEEWDHIESTSDQVIEEILACYRFFQSHPLATTHLGRLLEVKKGVENQLYGVIHESALAYTALGLEYYESRKYQNAEEVLQRAIALNPYQKNAHCLLGAIYELQMQFDKAIHHLKTAIMIQPDDDQLRKRLVSLYACMERFQSMAEHQHSLSPS